MLAIIEYLLSHLQVFYALVLFVFGTAVGSFLNVVICRLPYELSLLHPPSSCPKCGNAISIVDNLPLISWLILRGRCRKCQVPISWRYPGVELLTGLLWAGVGYMDALNDHGLWLNIALLMAHLLFVSALVAITFIDFDHQIIPDELSLGGLAASVVVAGLVPPLHLHYVSTRWFPASAGLEGVLRALVGAAAGAGIVYAVSVAGTIGFRKQIEKAQELDPEIDSAIGLGDVKLMAFVGALLGWESVLLSFLVGTCVGAFGGVFVKFATGESSAADAGGEMSLGEKLAHRWQTGDSIIPFGPFLVVGTLVLFFARERVVGLFVEMVLGDLPPPGM